MKTEPAIVTLADADRVDRLPQFVHWWREGKFILSTSCMRYGRESATSKSWEHLAFTRWKESTLFLQPGGWREVINLGTETANIVHVHHSSGVEIVLAAVSALLGGFGRVSVYGTKGSLSAKFTDAIFAFKSQFEMFVESRRTGEFPVPFEETGELMEVIIAGMRSRQEDLRKMPLQEIEE